MTKNEKLIERIRRLPKDAEFGEVRLLLEISGWKCNRTSGSHFVYRKPGERHISVPKHDGRVKRHYLVDLCDLLGLNEEV